MCVCVCVWGGGLCPHNPKRVAPKANGDLASPMPNVWLQPCGEWSGELNETNSREIY